MNLSKTSKYALRILYFIASKNDQRYSAQTLYEKLDIPEKYLRRLLTKLSKSGLIISSHGRNGGYTLSKPANQINLYSIINVVDSFKSLNECMLGYESCAFEVKCGMHHIWQETRDSLVKTLSSTTLADLAFKDAIQMN